MQRRGRLFSLTLFTIDEATRYSTRHAIAAFIKAKITSKKSRLVRLVAGTHAPLLHRTVDNQVLNGIAIEHDFGAMVCWSAPVAIGNLYRSATR